MLINRKYKMQQFNSPIPISRSEFPFSEFFLGILMYPRLDGGCEISLTRRRADRHKNPAACHKHFPLVSKLSFYKIISPERNNIILSSLWHNSLRISTRLFSGHFLELGIALGNFRWFLAWYFKFFTHTQILDIKLGLKYALFKVKSELLTPDRIILHRHQLWRL